MDDVIRCVDLFGHEVVLKTDRWVGHVLPDHVEMLPLLWAIEQALVNPDLVNEDADFDDRLCFYLLSVAGSRQDRHVKVCVEYGVAGESGRLTGRVITAYVTRSVKNREVEKWRRGN